MIRAYTTNSEHAAVLEAAAHLKGYPLQIQVEFDPEALEEVLPDVSVLVFDFHDPAFSPETVIPHLDSLEEDDVPPVLCLLSGAAQVELLATIESVFNQDYAFAPIAPEALALRLEVLITLGQRRRLTLESAITDRLTGLYNRKYFLRRLEEEMYRAQRYKYTVGVILADLDFSTDDGISEAAGTAAIQRVASFLGDRLRKTDVTSRFRWSQFAVLLPDIPAEDSLAVARDLKQKVEALDIRVDGRKVALRASVGQLVVPVDGLDTALQVVEAAEDCAFAAKSNPDRDVVSYAK